MPRVNPWSLPFAALPEERREFEDGNGGTFTLAMRALDGLEFTKAGAVGQQYVESYVEPPAGQPLLPIAGPSGEAIELDEGACRLIAWLEQMQVTENGEPPYSFMDWIGFAKHRRDVWLWGIEAVNTLMGASQDRLKNSPAAPGSSPAPRSRKARSATPIG